MEKQNLDNELPSVMTRFDHFALVDDFLEKLQFKAWNWMEANLRIQGDSLRNERANFGVQQLPLFNLLTPEELDW